MRLPKFHYAAPKTLEEALSLLAELGPEARPVAGGTDVLVRMKHHLLKPSALVSLMEIEELRPIRFDPEKGLTIGATALLAQVASHPDIRRHYPAVASAAQKTANVQIRNMGTVAGNLCNAAPSADNAPTLLAMGAELHLASPAGGRTLPLEQFFKGPRQTALGPAELLTSIFVPLPPPGSGVSYQHVSARGRVDISAVCVGAMAVFDGETCRETRIALGAVAPTPFRSLTAEAPLRGTAWTRELLAKAGDLAAVESRPITDVRASAGYRRQMVAVLTRRALMEAKTRAAQAR